MGTLAEFLKEQSEKLRGGAPERAKNREEWVAAVERLIRQIEGWLREADPEKVLEVERTAVELGERQLGRYTAPGLTITLGSERAQVRPGTRYGMGPMSDDGLTRGRSQGRVDLTDGVQTYRLYRYVEPGEEWWVIVDDEHYIPKRFDRPAFEAALVSLLK
jgi:hypothetical protein